MVDTPDIPGRIPGQILPSTSSQNVIGKTPPSIATASEGNLLNAVVVRHDNAGNAVLLLQNAGAQKSELTVASQIALLKGSNLVLKVLPQVGAAAAAKTNPNIPFQAQIVSVNGRPPQAPAGSTGSQTSLPGQAGVPAYAIVRAVTPNIPQAASGQVASQAGASAPTGATVVNVSQGVFVDGVVINPSSDAAKFLPGTNTSQAATSAAYSAQGLAPPNTSAPALKPSDGITLHVLNSSIQGTKTAQTASPTSPTNPGNVSAYQQLSSGQKTTGNQPIQPQLQTSAPNASNIPATTASNPVSPVTSNPSFVGTVIGTEQSGEVVLKTPIGTIKIPSNIALPQGSTLTLEAVKLTQQAPQIQNIIADEALQSGAKLSTHASALRELIALLASYDMQSGAALMNKIIPQAQTHVSDKQAAAKLLWFMINIQSGDARTWLGPETQRMLERDHRNLMTRIEKAFSAFRGMFAEPNNNGWHTLLFPYYDGSKAQIGRFYSRRDEGNQKRQRSNKDGQRFIVELELETFGDMQLDGFIHSSKESNHFDLIIRTRMNLPNDMQGDILDIFQNSADMTGVQGAVQFHVTNDFPVHPLEDTPEGDPGILA